MKSLLLLGEASGETSILAHCIMALPIVVLGVMTLYTLHKKLASGKYEMTTPSYPCQIELKRKDETVDGDND